MSVYIKKVKISNFRSVKTEEFLLAIPNGKLGSGLTVIVGPNNVGKSNVCRAIDGLFNKFTEQDKTCGINDSTEIEIEFTSEDFNKSIETYVLDNKQRVYKDAVLDDGSLHAKRSDNEGINMILLKQSDGEFKNQSGIDAPFNAWMKLRTIGPEYTTEDATKYSSKSILGDLLSNIFQEIETESRYEDLKAAFKDLFEDNSIFEKKSEEISQKVSGYIKDFYGEVGINFIPDRPDITALTKNVHTIVKDGSHDSDVSTKGSGLQRAVVLALIQTYAASFEKAEHKKPFYLIIDEPELSLSAQGQKRLLNALRVITQKEQVILITHSPYFVNWSDLENGGCIGRASFDRKNGTKLHWLQDGTNYSKLIQSTTSDWQRPYLLDNAAKEILFSDKVLMLEGQEDVGLIRRWARDNNKNYQFDIFGYGVQGYTNFKPYLQLAHDIGLTKVSAIYDKGESEDTQLTEDKKNFPKYLLSQLVADDIRDKFSSCMSCKDCKTTPQNCKSQKQTKDGCFDKHGSPKTGTDNFKNFETTMQSIATYLDESD